MVLIATPSIGHLDTFVGRPKVGKSIAGTGVDIEG
jgi:hypothetical protein